MSLDLVNALCVDADDLAFSQFEAGVRLSRPTYEAERETEDLLEALAQLGVVATFFVPGRFVGTTPRLVRTIAERGHQVASHGTRHVKVEQLSRSEFSEDVRRSKQALEDLIGELVDTYKAPVWSITPRCAWAYDALVEAGFRVDHSAMPRLKRHLGYRGDRLEPFTHDGGLLVIPVTSVRLLGLTVPFPGGFYNAHVPFAIQRRLYDRINRRGLPFNLYFHPFEHSPTRRNRSLLKYGSPYVSLYAAHAGRYRGLLARLAATYRLGSLQGAYARWLRPRP